MKRAERMPATRVVVRTPVLPFDVLVRWGGDAPRDEAALRADLRALLEDPVIREAIFVSSPELATNLDAWLADPAHPETRDLEQAVVRYVSRMAGRATPFGLMSGIAVGTVAPATELALAARDDYRREIRLDNDYLVNACAAISALPEIRAGLRYRPNSSLYLSAGRLRYLEARLGAMRSYHLVVVEPSDYLMAVIDRARAGVSVADLVAVLMEDPDVGTDDAEGFVAQLIDTQVLVPDLEPPVTGPEPVGPIVERLRELPAAARFADALDTARREIAAIEALPLGVPGAAYRAIAAGLDERGPVPTKVELLFQVDLYKPAPALTLGGHVVDEVVRGLELLRRIGTPSQDESWARFRNAFVERYASREVPLVEVLDEEVGIGFLQKTPASAPLLEGVTFPKRPGARHAAWDKRDHHLLRLLHAAIREGAREIVLTEADEAALTRDPAARLFDVVATPLTIAAASSAAIDAGDYQIRMVGIDAPGVRMLGRFCHGSPEITALVRDQIAIEEARRPDAIFAEVVHLPEGRLGNVLLRPVLRGHEIPFLGRSGADEDHQIPVTDLLVSVIGSRIVLRSRRLDREVVPRLTSAHNFSQFSLGVYRFLCSLAQQDGGGAGWSWGALGDAPYLPRLRSGRIVLSRARWLLDKADLAPIAAAARSARPVKPGAAKGRDAVIDAVAALRTRLALPRWIVITDGDNELPVDLDNRLMVASFANLVRTQDSVTINELFPAPDQLCVRGPEGAYAHELLVLFSREGAPLPPILPAKRPVEVPATERYFHPGSSWLFVKLYTGFAMCDALIRALAPVARELIASGAATQWFFIRYGDPEWHLRIRFAGAPDVLLSRVLPRLEAELRQFVDTGLVWKTQLDVYEREIERYGGREATELAERVFAADSEAVATIVETYVGDDGADLTWRLALRGIDRLLDDLGLSFDDKRKVVTDMRDQLGSEVGMDTDFQRLLGEKFRKHRADVEAIVSGTDVPADPFGPGLAAIDRRSAAIRPLAAELHRLRDAGRLTQTIPALATSYMHMHVNRIMAAAPRSQELLLYDLLRRYYDGVVGRAKQAARSAR